MKGWCQRHDVDCQEPVDIIKTPVVIKRFQREIAKYNAFFGETEQVKKFELVADEWSQKSGILTPTLKVKRHIVLQKYKDLIDKIYGL